MDHSSSSLDISVSSEVNAEERAHVSSAQVVHSKTNSNRRGPSADMWKVHKDTIIKLYRTHKLSDVMQEMEHQHEFIAT